MPVAPPEMTTRNGTRHYQMSPGVRLPDFAIHTYTKKKKVFIVYLEFKFNCMTHMLSGNPTPGGGGQNCHPSFIEYHWIKVEAPWGF